MTIRALSLVCLLVLALAVSVVADDGTILIPRDRLLADARQLLEIIEASHPAPYGKSGDRMQFHMEYQLAISAIPDSGMTAVDFWELMLPLVASVDDSHTSLVQPVDSIDDGPGLPLDFKVIDEELIVVRISDDRYSSLMGSKLRKVAGVSYYSLKNRLRNRVGADNRFTRMSVLRRSLGRRNSLASLVPEWTDTSEIRASFELTDGSHKTFRFACPGDTTRSLVPSEPSVNLPSVRSNDLAYSFLDDDSSVAFLRIAALMRFREGFEANLYTGNTRAPGIAREAYRHFHGDSTLPSKAKTLFGLPSASETLVALLNDMKRVGAKDLIIDLRDNPGGIQAIRFILAYFLFGVDGLKSIPPNRIVTRLSELYCATYPKESVEWASKRCGVPLKTGDYDFSGFIDTTGWDDTWEQRQTEFETFFTAMPAFNRYYMTEDYHSPRVNINNLIVLCSPSTHSSAFCLMRDLKRHGALVIGTPSGQSPNAHIDPLGFALDHSGICGQVSSCFWISEFGIKSLDDVVPIDIPLTMSNAAECNYDPDMEVIIALRILEQLHADNP